MCVCVVYNIYNIIGYFSEIERDNYDTTQGVLLTTNFNNEYIIFKNSTIENVNVQSPLPLIYGNSMTLE